MSVRPTSLPGVNPELLANPELCTLDTCPLILAHVQYDPNLAGNVLYLAIFSIVLAFQVFLGIYYRTWGYMAAMSGGLILEIIGYIARVQMHFNPFTQNPFLM
jgi:hypothetical protein